MKKTTLSGVVLAMAAASVFTLAPVISAADENSGSAPQGQMTDGKMKCNTVDGKMKCRSMEGKTKCRSHEKARARHRHEEKMRHERHREREMQKNSDHDKQPQ